MFNQHGRHTMFGNDSITPAEIVRSEYESYREICLAANHHARRLREQFTAVLQKVPSVDIAQQRHTQVSHNKTYGQAQ